MILNQIRWQSLGGQHGKGVDGLFDKVSFQTAFEVVESGWKSDIKTPLNLVKDRLVTWLLQSGMHYLLN